MSELAMMVILSTSIWVYFDARSMEMRPKMKGFFEMGPLGWAFSCLLFWVLAFPVYLVKRKHLSKSGTSGKKSVPIKSFTDESTSYSIDREKLSCTCPDFQNIRHEYARHDPRRLCKHLVAIVCENNNVPDAYQKYLNTLTICMENKRGFPLNRKRISGTFGIEQIELWVPTDIQTNQWLDVHIGNKRYGYNAVKRRWAYGQKPQAATQIEQWLDGRNIK